MRFLKSLGRLEFLYIDLFDLLIVKLDIEVFLARE